MNTNPLLCDILSAMEPFAPGVHLPRTNDGSVILDREQHRQLQEAYAMLEALEQE